jgi:hypothetical protein
MSGDGKSTFDAQAKSVLDTVLKANKEHIVSRWTEIVHGTYPFDTVGFLRTVKDRFSNPVGYRTEEAARALMEAIFHEEPDQDALNAAVEEIIRVRAIQDFPPEAAVGIIFAIKDIIRDVARRAAILAESAPALFQLESRIDAVALLAFGAYARSRETLYRLKVDEFKRQHSQLLRLAERKAAKISSDKAETHN